MESPEMQDSHGPGIKTVKNETEALSSRTTRAGRHFTYKLVVLQQPLRARACGSGAKSSADRRPVDPPPIVELKIFEHTQDGDQDVTFSMNANYFLFVTLEQARNVAKGRVQQDQSRLTVLTGTPVAGMVYLDRPSPAGYFIFPDLSVRHEGKYRLSFSLYEELKDAMDEDRDDDLSKANGAGDAHVTHRMEVKSAPFTVYSAKKFPGLTESTSLSRMVAEQGCRVRIRRDVRMRRRDPKGRDWNPDEDGNANSRGRVSASPEARTPSEGPTPRPSVEPVPRPRAGSHVSHHSLAASIPPSRRSSVQDLRHEYPDPSQAYHQPPTYGSAPHTPQAAYPPSSPYGPSPAQSFAPNVPYVQHPPAPHYTAPTYQPAPHSATAPQSYYAYPSGPATHPPMAQPPYHAQTEPSQSAYGSQGQFQRLSVDYSNQAAEPLQPDYTSQPSYQPAPPPSQYGYAPAQTYQHSYAPADAYNNRAAPLEPLQPPTRATGAKSPLNPRMSMNEQLPPLSTTMKMNSSQYLEPNSPASAAPQGNHQSAPAHGTYDKQKRGFGSVFNDMHLSQPLRQGARPNTDSVGLGVYQTAEDLDEGADHDLPADQRKVSKMSYRRADGRHCERSLRYREG